MIKELSDRQKQTLTCSHTSQTRRVEIGALVCPQCVEVGDTWVHLRVCMTCGQVGCCDSSKNKHATAHYQEVKHPVVMSIEPRERWAWCYEDEEAF